jgi:alpha-beta hydrolase superfamily lysophospholipase
LQDERAIGIGGNELLLNALPRAFGVLFIGLRQIAHAHAPGQRVGEHAACGGLEEIARLAAVSHDLPPESGLCVLNLDDRGHGAIERGDKRGALRMGLVA